MATGVKRYNQSATPKLMTYSDLVQSRSVTIENPALLQQVTLFRTTTNVMIESASAVIVGSDDPVVRFEVRSDASRATSPGKLIGVQANNITSTTTPDEFAMDIITSDVWVWLKITDVQGTVNSVTITFTMRGGVGDTEGTTPAPPPPPPAFETIVWESDTLTQDAGSLTFYVSSSTGNDTTGDGSIGSPYATIAKAYSFMRDAHSDWMLLKKDDTWTESLVLRRGGLSASKPMLFGAYGAGARPRINVANGTEAAFITGLPEVHGGSGTQAHNVAFVGLHIYGSGYTGTNNLNGVTFQQWADNLLIEDCRFERLKTGIVVQLSDADAGVNVSHNYRIRGCVFVDQFCTANGGGGGANTSQGIFGGNAGETTNIDGLLIEFNVFDHNGWLEPGDNPNAVLTWLRHSGYISNNIKNFSLRNNIIMRSDGVMVRCGGIVENNFNLNTYGPLLYGQGTNPERLGVSGEIFNNVSIDGRDILSAPGLASVPGPIGMDIGNVAEVDIHDNIWAHQMSGTGAAGVRIWTNNHTQGQTRTIASGFFRNNIFYGWGGVCINFDLGATDQQCQLQINSNALDNAVDNALLISESSFVSNASITGSGNSFYSQHVTSPTTQWFTVAGVASTLAQWKTAMTPDDETSVNGRITYVDAARDEATYQSALGATATRDAFITACRAQSKDAWDDDYTAPAINAYIREGFTPV